MDTSKDKIIQNFLDEQETHPDVPESDLKAYQFIYDALEKPLDKGFSLGFPSQIIRKIEAKQQRRFNLKIYSLFSLLLVMSLGFSAVFFSGEQFSALFSIFLKYKFIVLFFLAVVISVQLCSRFLTAEKLEN
ncbi:hypothetical protein M2347_004031 [Chryseobacterium sp. H1D6B]|uniref:hypothetical protein n=1 Tax=Chryseobacterium sp. H1D6B TaxID=2940588 RepID=UPI0015C8392A|nr:hypothetical protein [Chryseobacterium sp. H1D6B]MDH6254304.1 hypothetical protein [Chryseobacterium sp. H1D6B]